MTAFSINENVLLTNILFFLIYYACIDLNYYYIQHLLL